jgi:hypothetical protein
MGCNCCLGVRDCRMHILNCKGCRCLLITREQIELWQTAHRHLRLLQRANDSKYDAARNSDYAANLSDVASSSCDALTWASSEYCRKQRQQCCTNTFYTTCITSHSLTANRCLYCTDRETIHSTKMTNAHAQFFLVNNVLLLPNLKAFARFTRSLHATRNASYFQSVRSSRTVCLSLPLIAVLPKVNNPRTAPDTPTPLSGSSPCLLCINTVQRYLWNDVDKHRNKRIRTR